MLFADALTLTSFSFAVHYALEDLVGRLSSQNPVDLLYAVQGILQSARKFENGRKHGGAAVHRLKKPQLLDGKTLQSALNLMPLCKLHTKTRAIGAASVV